MWKWLLRVAGFVWLVLLAGALWLWVRSWGVHDVLTGHRYWREPGPPNELAFRQHYLWLNSSQGKATVSWMVFVARKTGGTSTGVLEKSGGEGSIKWELTKNPLNVPVSGRARYSRWIGLAGFGYGSDIQMKRPDSPTMVLPSVVMKKWCVLLPWWGVALLFGVTPAWCVMAERRRWRRRKREREGLCLACGYDLRGSREICPECGAPARTQGGTGVPVAEQEARAG